MSFEAFESSNLQNSVPLEGLGMAGALRIKYRISLIYCFLDELINIRALQLQRYRRFKRYPSILPLYYIYNIYY